MAEADTHRRLARPTSLGTATRIALVLSLAVILIGAVRFGRYDWTGIPFERSPLTAERVVSAECTEYVRPYTTSSGRVVQPVTVDEQQYMSLVQFYRGVPRSELHVTCLLGPFTTRAAVPWVAAQLPFDEGASMGAVNLLMTVVATWAVVLALAAQGFRPRVVALVGAAFAISWNTLFFSSGVLVDAGAVALVALSWLALAYRRPWFVAPLLLLSYPLRETAALVVLPVLAVWLLGEIREHRTGRVHAGVILGVCAAAALVSVVATGMLAEAGDAMWEVRPTMGALINNVVDPIGLVGFAIATVPIGFPAVAEVLRRVRDRGWARTLLDPAVVGVAVTMALLVWVTAAADLSSRFAWIGFPFAATLAAAWLSTRRPRNPTLARLLMSEPRDLGRSAPA